MALENVYPDAAHFGSGETDAGGPRYAQWCQTLTHRSLMQKRVNCPFWGFVKCVKFGHFKNTYLGVRVRTYCTKEISGYELKVSPEKSGVAAAVMMMLLLAHVER